MTDFTGLSNNNLASITPSSETIPALSPLLSLLGFQDNRLAIQQGDDVQRLLVETVETDYAEYLTANNQHTKTNLLSSLTALTTQLNKELSLVEKRLQKVRQPKQQGYLRGMTDAIKTTLGLDEASEADHYIQQIKQYQVQLDELQKLHADLEHHQPSNRRQLLDTPAPAVNFIQACYPVAGACSLSDLNGRTGFGLKGAKYSDYSAWSINSAGDFNGDGYEDLLIGAYGGANKIGMAYLVFGNSSATWQYPSLNLADLNGRSGVAFQGEVINDAFGWSVTAGDYDNDGFSDLAFSAPGAQNSAGKTYVLRGTNSSWNYGLVNISTLMNGRDGYALQAPSANDFSGYSITTIPNFTGNGIPALVIGAPPIANTDKGKCYIVFGRANNTWVNGTMDLESLMDGQRGVKFVGKAAQDLMAIVVNSAGDPNGDGLSDLLIFLRGKSQSALVFGSNNSSLWGNGTVLLDTLLDGRRGVTFQSNTTNVNGGTMGSPGDINGDGVDDLYIGEADAYNNAGKVTIVFGQNHTTAYGNGTVDLSTVNDGIKGFQIAGLSPNDRTGGGLVRKGADFNNDGLKDLLFAAPGDSVNTGKTHVVYGSSDPNRWKPGMFNASSFDDGTKGFSIKGEASNDFSSNQITSLDMNGDGLPDLAIAARGALDSAGETYIIFGRDPLSAFFSKNHMSIGTGETVVLTAEHIALNSTRTDFNTSTADISVTNMVNGFFAFKSAPATSISSFTMQNILDGNILFKHIGGPFAPSYTLDFKLGINRIVSVAAIEFAGFRPNIINNQQAINQGIDSPITPDKLSANDQDTQPNELRLIISDVQYGRFTLFNPLTNSTANATEFSYQDILNSYVTFVPDGSRNKPSYKVAVTDGISTSINQTAAISFNFAPQLELPSTAVTIDEGQATLIGPDVINATDVETFNGALTLTAVNISGGHFAYITNPNNSINQFAQSSVTAGLIAFVQKGNAQPGFTLSASDGTLSSEAQTAVIHLNHIPTSKNTMVDRDVVQGDAFSFGMPSDLFNDPDKDTLTYQAQQQGGAPLPDGVSFSPSGVFSGTLPVVGSFPIEVIATDPRGLKTSARFTLRSQEPHGLNSQQVTSLGSSLGGALFTALAYLYLRRRISKHRDDFSMANHLRKTLNLEYYDFSRFDGDFFKTKVENFLIAINISCEDFYKKLSPQEQQCFAVCVAEVLIQQGDLVAPSNITARLFSKFCFLNVGAPNHLDITQFDRLATEIANQAMDNWKKEQNPCDKWPYLTETRWERFNVFCCGRKPYWENRFSPAPVSQQGLFAKPLRELKEHEKRVSTHEEKGASVEMTEVEAMEAGQKAPANIINSPGTSS